MLTVCPLLIMKETLIQENIVASGVAFGASNKDLSTLKANLTIITKWCTMKCTTWCFLFKRAKKAKKGVLSLTYVNM